MRLFTLYARSRLLPATGVAVLGCAFALWILGLAIDDPQGRALAALLAALAATTAIGPGLAGPDHDLDKSAAIAWPPRRVTHVVLAGSAVLALLAATTLPGEQMASAGQIARNVAGLTGLVALGAVLLGAARAPLVPVVWTIPLLWWAPPLGDPPTQPAYRVVLTWMVQRPDSANATLTAILLAVVGTFAYATMGARR